MACFRRVWVKEPGHSEKKKSAKKEVYLNRSIVARVHKKRKKTGQLADHLPKLSLVL